MNAIGLDDNIYTIHLTGCLSNSKSQNKSGPHLAARKIIKETFPTFQILEEVPVKISKYEILYLDFYLPLIKTCIEVHGEQHYKFSKFYHINMMGFAKAKKRDENKKQWCLLNNIKYIVFPYDESPEQWKQKINNE